MSQLETNMRIMIDRIKILFAYKQRLTNQKKPLRSLKLHLIQHSFFWIRYFGSLLGQDTERWESYLRTTKDVYRGARKRRTGISQLMMNRVRYMFLICFLYVSYMFVTAF